MRSVQITGWGGPEVLQVADTPRPSPAAGQVLVEVKAVGINPVDWKIREGYMKDFLPNIFPMILGNEFSGTVIELGGGVAGFKIGDKVHGVAGMVGAFAEYVAASPDAITKMPDGLSFEEAAALPVAAVTAEAALEAGKVGVGTRILIHAAAGGVGSVAVQMAKARGAEVTALTSSANTDFVRGLGADHIVDRSSAYENTLGKFDVVLDAFGPEAQARSWSLLAPGGIMVSLVAPPDEETAKKHGATGVMVFGSPNAAVLAKADALIAAGKLSLSIARTWPVEEIAAALAESQKGQVRGKLVATF